MEEMLKLIDEFPSFSFGTILFRSVGGTISVHLADSVQAFLGNLALWNTFHFVLHFISHMQFFAARFCKERKKEEGCFLFVKENSALAFHTEAFHHLRLLFSSVSAFSSAD